MNIAWETLRDTYNVRVLLVPEADGGYSVFAMDLPGCCSQGDTPEEAMANIRDAFIGLLQVYAESKMPIPWKRGCYEEFCDLPTERRMLIPFPPTTE